MMSISIATRRRSRLIATARRRQIRYAIVAGAMLALTLSRDIGALAQTNNASTNATRVYGPKQVGPWAVSGWTRDSGPYCTAERPLPGAAGSGRDTELTEERTFLTVRDSKGSYRLEALVVRPAKAEGRLPVALITHGKNGKAQENQQLSADLMLPQARDLAMRG